MIIQQDAKEYSLFKSVNCSTCFGWYFTHHQELITLYLQYLALVRPVLLATCRERGWMRTEFSSSCRYSVMSSWWWVKYHPKHVEQLIDLNKLYSVASCWIIIAIFYDARPIEHTVTVVLKIYIEVLNAFLSILIVPSCQAVASVLSVLLGFVNARTALLPDHGPERAETCRRF